MPRARSHWSRWRVRAMVGGRGDRRMQDDSANAWEAAANIDGFHILLIGADIADMRKSESDDLPGIGKVLREDFLVAGHGGVEADFANRLRPVAPRPKAFNDRAVREDEQRRSDGLAPGLAAADRSGVLACATDTLGILHPAFAHKSPQLGRAAAGGKFCYYKAFGLGAEARGAAFSQRQPRAASTPATAHVPSDQHFRGQPCRCARISPSNLKACHEGGRQAPRRDGAHDHGGAEGQGHRGARGQGQGGSVDAEILALLPEDGEKPPGIRRLSTPRAARPELAQQENEEIADHPPGIPAETDERRGRRGGDQSRHCRDRRQFRSRIWAR